MSTEAAAPVGTEQRAQPESFRARALAASITVKDLDQSIAWYCDGVGFTITQRRERDGKVAAVSLVAGTVRILLNQDDGAKGWDRTKALGFSMMITTAQSVDDVAARIKQHGYPLLSEPADMPWGPRAFRVQDPDGFTYVFVSETNAA